MDDSFRGALAEIDAAILRRTLQHAVRLLVEHRIRCPGDRSPRFLEELRREYSVVLDRVRELLDRKLIRAQQPHDLGVVPVDECGIGGLRHGQHAVHELLLQLILLQSRFQLIPEVGTSDD